MNAFTARSALLLLAVAVLLPATVVAHHSFAMFDMDKNVTYSGVVTAYRWMNPHVHITMEIAPGPGVDAAMVGEWDVEGGSTVIMGRQGWTRASYKAGDPITLVGHPMRDGSKGISLFYAIKSDGSRLYHDIARPKAESE